MRHSRHGRPHADDRSVPGADEPSRTQDHPVTVDSGEGTMHIDCASCPVRGEACDDCLVSVLLGPPQIDEAASAAIAVLSERGLVPPLRDPRSGSTRAG